MEKICNTCKKSFKKTPSDSKTYWKKKKYCSLPCSNTWFPKGHQPKIRGNLGKIGAECSSWKGGRSLTGDGYIRLCVQGEDRYVREHRKVMEDCIGRKLERREHVHHKNGNKTDNRLENLQIMDICEHGSLHSKQRWASVRGKIQ